VTDDDGFGPAVRGGGHSPRGAVLNPRPRPRSRADAYLDHGPPDRDDAGFAPAEKGRRRRVRRPRALRIVLLVLLIGLLAFVATGVAAALSASSKIDRIDVDGLQSVDGGRRNILIVGSDDREGMTRRQRRALGTGNFDGNRTDTILLLSIQGSRGAMLSFPRDLYVERCDGSSGRINGAHGIGGASCLVETVSRASGIPISQYLEVDFLGFHDIVQAVGGVRMCLKEPIQDDDAHIDLPKGCQRLNGRDALGFVRVRKIDDDLGRIERQQRFMKALARQAAQPSTVLNPLRLFPTGNAVGEALTANRGLGVMDLAALGRAGAAMGQGDFPTFAVPANPAWVGGASVLALDEAEAEPIFRSFRDGSVLDLAGSGDVAPEDVRVRVLNGAGVPGMAQAAADVLTERGFQVTRIGNHDPVERTVIEYTEGHQEEAELVANQAPGQAELRQVGSGPPVVLILGADAADALGR